jgi:hypothetical protein
MDKATPEFWKWKDEPPPFLGEWKRIYLLVLLYLFTLIGGLYAVTRIFRY